MLKRTTIVGLATPPGRGGVGIIRLSGPMAYKIALQLNGNTLLKPRMAQFCSFYINDKSYAREANKPNKLCHDQELIDKGLMLYFKTPNSFTGEDVIEIQAHGSPIVLDRLIKETVLLGASLAEPGEFSKRAFLNGKIDLTQAEAIADLISASSETAARMALKSLQGHFSHQIKLINEQLIQLRIFVEAALDFSEEEIDFLSEGRIAERLSTILTDLNALRSSAHQGLIVREGISIVIAGHANVGKSTLINTLAGKDLAIVTDIAGTTRDVMRASILLDDLPLHIIDTAGLRETDCRIEQEGIKRAWQELKTADCVLWVKDVTQMTDDDSLIKDIREHLPQKIPIIQILNKIDSLDSVDNGSIIPTTPACYSLSAASMDPADNPPVKPWKRDIDFGMNYQETLGAEFSETCGHLLPFKQETVYISAKTGAGIEDLKRTIKQAVGYQALEGQFLARRRHLQALDEAKKCLEIGQQQVLIHRAGELLAEDLRQAHQILCEITGEFSSDDLLGKIFSSFCIGK